MNTAQPTPPASGDFASGSRGFASGLSFLVRGFSAVYRLFRDGYDRLGEGAKARGLGGWFCHYGLILFVATSLGIVTDASGFGIIPGAIFNPVAKPEHVKVLNSDHKKQLLCHVIDSIVVSNRHAIVDLMKKDLETAMPARGDYCRVRQTWVGGKTRPVKFDADYYFISRGPSVIHIFKAEYRIWANPVTGFRCRRRDQPEIHNLQVCPLAQFGSKFAMIGGLSRYSQTPLHCFVLAQIHPNLKQTNDDEQSGEPSDRVTPFRRIILCLVLGFIGCSLALREEENPASDICGYLLIAAALVLWWLPFFTHFTRNWWL